MSRRLSREYAIQFLFSFDLNKNENLENMLEEFFEMKESNYQDDEVVENLSKGDKNFTLDIVQGTISKLDEIDETIKVSAIGWKKERIAKVDLAILRLAVYEILYRDDIPDSVTANESIELSKKFSTDDSSSFVNGVLGRIIREKPSDNKVAENIVQE